MIKAYGLRASQIAENPEVNPKGSKDDGPFQDYIGVDGTSIWAAATSSSAATAAHLLACMLATLWPADKAVAILVELVNERKRLLEAMVSSSNSFRVEDVAASQMSLSQEQLAMWDSSARAWLKAAEDAPFVKSRQQDLRTVLRDINATVSGEKDLYSSVTEAWRRALSTFEAIMCGASFDISDGSFILALLSWHLYPNIVTVTTRPQIILHNDDLIRGGQVIVGLSRQDQSPPGVHWCLSLNHLLYYGASQQITQSIALGDPQQNRLTLSDFTLILLGGLIGLWSCEEKIETSLALEIIGRVISTVKKGLAAVGNRFSNAESKIVLDHPADAMSRHQTHGQVDNGLSTKLIELGIRYQRFFTSKRIFTDVLVSGRLQAYSPFNLFGMNNLYFGAAFAQQDDRLEYRRRITRKLIASMQDPDNPLPCFLLVFKLTDNKERKAYFYWRRITDDGEIAIRDAQVELKTFVFLKRAQTAKTAIGQTLIQRKCHTRGLCAGIGLQD